MLGVRSPSLLVLVVLAVGGLVLLALVWAALGRPRPRRNVDLAFALACAVATAAVPYLVWRVVDDVRYTTALDPYERSAAGPIQAFLPGYLLDGADRLLPPDATYATSVGAGISSATARKAFPALATSSLFPRRSAPPDEAQWLVAWGVDRAKLRRLGAVSVVRAAEGSLPAVLVVRIGPR
jgi:hypothetical protein